MIKKDIEQELKKEINSYIVESLTVSDDVQKAAKKILFFLKPTLFSRETERSFFY